MPYERIPIHTNPLDLRTRRPYPVRVSFSKPSPPVSSPIRELRFADCDQLSELVSSGEVQFIQLGSGPCKASMMRIDLDGFYLLLTEVSNRTACHTASRKGVRVIHIPLRWSGSLHWNGRTLERSGVIVWGDSCDYCRVGGDVRTVALIIDEAAIRERIEIWAGSSHGLWDSLDGHMLADTPASRHFAEVIAWVVGLAARGSGSLGVPAVRAQLSERLLLALVNAVEAQGESLVVGPPIARDRTRIVRQMTDHLLAYPDRVVQLSDLCQLTGYSARSIAHACQTVLETSPMRYLKQLRLNQARILLREGTRDRTTVSECAYFAGFSHLGRFSADYRRMFGESPSQTLDRSM
ncbi:MAG: helix-turn-helix domain-containing protein [Akkermansiaceae bacterium]|jgi:AraC family ethanolamine operon transcriptional activator|nr:helix-turn-helix domain-containing protein [Akkermansiaceae bacterium]